MTSILIFKFTTPATTSLPFTVRPFNGIDHQYLLPLGASQAKPYIEILAFSKMVHEQVNRIDNNVSNRGLFYELKDFEGSFEQKTAQDSKKVIASNSATSSILKSAQKPRDSPSSALRSI